MTEKDESAAANSPRRRSWSGARRHEQAVIQAEVRRLARALRPSRVKGRDALERSGGAAFRPTAASTAPPRNDQ